MPSKKALADMRLECECENVKYCPLEQIVNVNLSDRMVEQHKCVEKFKFLESKKLGRDIGWNDAYMEWVNRGYAKRFNEIYSIDKSFKQTWKECNYENK